MKIKLALLIFFKFRSPLPQTMNRVAPRRGQDKLYLMTRDPIKQPLLKKLENNHDMVQEAVSVFLDILSLFLSFSCMLLKNLCFI